MKINGHDPGADTSRGGAIVWSTDSGYTLDPGRGVDSINVSKGEHGMYHVDVNGEIYSFSSDEMARLKIETYHGKETVSVASDVDLPVNIIQGDGWFSYFRGEYEEIEATENVETLDQEEMTGQGGFPDGYGMVADTADYIESQSSDAALSPMQPHELGGGGPAGTARQQAESLQARRGPLDQDAARAQPAQTTAAQQADQVAAAAELQQDRVAQVEQERAEEQAAAESGGESAELPAEDETAEQEEAAAMEEAERQEAIDGGEIDTETGEPIDIERAEPLSNEQMTDFQVEIATLDEQAEARVIEAVTDAEATGTLDQLDTEDLMAQEKEIQDRREEAELHRQDQERAQEEGDLQAAREFAAKAGDELQSAAWFDGRGSAERAEEVDVVEAGEDVAALDAAVWNREIAEEDAGTATDHAETADYEVAEMYAEDAAAAEGVVEAYADEGEDEDAGGSRYDESDTYDT